MLSRRTGFVVAFLVGWMSLSASRAHATISVSGSAADQQAWNDLITQCSNASPFFNTAITTIRNSAKDVVVVLVRSKKNVIIDSFDTKEVDLDDIFDYPPLDPPHTLDRCQQVLHLLWERYSYLCNPGAGFEAAHTAAVAEENLYRASLGYTDTLDPNVGLSGDGESICYLWHETGKPDVTTYVPISDQRSEGRVNVSSVTPTPTGVQYTLHIDPMYPNVDVLSVPACFGGGTVSIQGFGGQIVLEAVSSEYPNYDAVRVVQLQTTAPPFPLPPPFNSSGPNQLTNDPNGLSFGYYNRTNGQVSVTYSGFITNNFYPPSHPLPFYSSFFAIFHPGDTGAVFHTSAALLDGEPGQWWTHRSETVFVATLDTAQETMAPVTSTIPCGSARFVVQPNGSISGSVLATGLNGTPLFAHVHFGGWNVAGPVVVTLTPTGPSSWNGSSPPLTPAQRAQLASNQFYVDVHTSMNMSGEIRGQLVDPAVLEARLGNVNTGAGGSPADVLRVAGSVGHPVYRELVRPVGPVSFSIGQTPIPGNGLYAIWVMNGEPTSSTLTSALLNDGAGGSEVLGTGTFCLPSANTVTPGSCPCPGTLPVGFTSKALATNQAAARVCLHRLPADPRAPATLMANLPAGTYTFVGVIFDPNASTSGARKVSLTNSVTVKFQ
jgi:CHRD domain-containing protein